jgi:hypothetical protein
MRAPLAFAEPSDQNIAAASRAFTEGQKAELQGDPARAAELYELAHGIAPSPEALRSAVRNLDRAGQLPRAATLAEELRTRYQDSISQDLATGVIDRAKRELGQLSVQCSHPCALASEQHALVDKHALKHEIYLEPGAHTITASFGDRSTDTQQLTFEAGAPTAAFFTKPATVAKPAQHQPVAPQTQPAASQTPAPSELDDPTPTNKISPAWFGVGLAATVALGATTIWSGVDVLQRNEAYEDNPTQPRLDDGRKRETRTNVLIGATAVVGAATIVLAAVTDWKRHSRRKQQVANVFLEAGPSEAKFVVGGRF